MSQPVDQKSRKRALSEDENQDPPEKRRHSLDLRTIPTLSPLPSPAMTPIAPAPSQSYPPTSQTPAIDEDTHMMAASPALPNHPIPDSADMLEVDKALRPPGGPTSPEDPFAIPSLDPSTERKTQHTRHRVKQAKGKDAINQTRLPADHADPAFAPQPPPKHGQPPQPPSTKPLPGILQAPHPPPPPRIAPQLITSMPILPRHALPPAVNGVVIKGDFKYTEYPRNIPHLYPQLGCSILHNHQSEQIHQWESKDCFKVLAREFRAKFETNVEARRATRSLIEETITKFLDEKVSFVLSDPKINPSISHARTDPPWHTLVYDLTKSQYEKLLAHPIIATPSGVIIIAPLQQIIPTYIASITGITCRGNSEEGKRIVTEAVRKGLLSNASLADDFDQIAGPGSFQKILNDLNVYFVNTSDARPNDGWWNVESPCMPRHITIDQYRALTDRIKSLTFPTDDNGDGVALRKSRECMNCKSITHTVQTCPLYRMPGWLGPPREEPAQDNLGSKPTRGNGQRGRGGRSSFAQAKRGTRGYNGRV